MRSVIRVRDLAKTYHVTERGAGLAAALKSLVSRKTRQVKAVDRISFDISPGEMVGFLGPNGAGKTTSLKMLSGLLYPTAGEAKVLGFTPSNREAAFLKQITLVMGQRNQLVWDIPAADSFELSRAIYRIPRDDYRRTLDELVHLLDLEPLLGKPVRNLSLGERMKCEIAGALLHRPRVLFLDEPTIGLDVTAQRRIREFLKEYNARNGAAVLLTSHYMADVEVLCRRVLVIHHGHLIYDGDLPHLRQQFTAYKTIVVQPGDETLDMLRLAEYGEIVGEEAGQIHLRVPRLDAARITAHLLAEFAITDVSIVEPPIEEAIERIFALPDGEEAEAEPVPEVV
jgi:ABC-2 type transport system ATP-binding protein